ncbi:MAG: transglycosylase SLT domain-containing protein [Bacteroidaceae bacterium]|nr:transglycosylase SLT domain-containing protein [Bacteroidaceae bacterium]
MKYFPIAALLALVSCLAACGGDKPAPSRTGADTVAAHTPVYDLDSILASGEIVVATLRGADTYSEFQDTVIGFQHALADSLAEHLGVSLRFEVADDTAAFYSLALADGADVYALWLDSVTIDSLGLTPSAPRDSLTATSWAVRGGAEQLAAALNEWATDELCDTVEARLFRFIHDRRLVRKNEQPPYISLEKDILSIYDAHFKNAAKTCGWDWHLVGALCYEESGFDPNAVSGAGARGLMQVIARTAEAYGVKDFLEPRQNVEVAARHLKDIMEEFGDIKDKHERLKFAIAAYNCGGGHIRDAQALCRRSGDDPQSWQSVSRYCLELSKPGANRHPEVKHGLMDGAQTVMHVIKVMRRWEQYVGHLSTSVPTYPDAQGRHSDTLTVSTVSAEDRAASARPHPKPEKGRTNRFTQGTRILGPDDPRLLHVAGDTGKTVF